MKVLLLLSMICFISFTFAQSSKSLTAVSSFSNVPLAAAGSVVSYNLLNDNAAVLDKIFNKNIYSNPSSLLWLMDTTKMMTQQEQYQFYIQKRNRNNITGFILLGSGSIIAFIGLKNSLEQILAPKNNGPAVFLTGSAIALLSIPFLIAGGKNKRKANLALKRIGVPSAAMNNNSYNNIAVALKMQF